MPSVIILGGNPYFIQFKEFPLAANLFVLIVCLLADPAGRLREGSGKVQRRFREGSGKVQGRFREGFMEGSNF